MNARCLGLEWLEVFCCCLRGLDRLSDTKRCREKASRELVSDTSAEAAKGALQERKAAGKSYAFFRACKEVYQ